MFQFYLRIIAEEPEIPGIIKQDVVQIAIEPENSPEELLPHAGTGSMYLDNSHTIEIEAKGLLIRMNNNVQPVLLKVLMNALKESLC